MRMSAQLVVPSDGKYRVAARDAVDAPSTLRPQGGGAADVHIRDLSASGCFIETGIELSVGDPARIGLAGAGAINGQVARIANDGVAVMFDRPLTPVELDEAFTGAQIIQPWGRVGNDAEADNYERWPRPVRTTIAVGSSVALWALIFYAVSIF